MDTGHRTQDTGNSLDLSLESWVLRPRAFTLIELLVVLSMVGVVMGALLTSFLIGQKSYLSADAYVQVQQEARRAFDVMVKELREAGNMDSSVTAPNAAFANQTRINFQIARGYDLNGTLNDCPVANICWGNENDPPAPPGDGNVNNGWVHYLLIGTQLGRCLSAGSDTAIASLNGCRILANDVQTFQVSYAIAPTNTVTIQLAIQQSSQQLPGGSMSTTPAPLRTQVQLRNLSP